jgi:glutamate dehydrogenase (NADP+)
MIDYVSQGKESFKGKRVVVSGSGNVAQYAALKAHELGATVLSLSDSQGSLIATTDEGFQPEHIRLVQGTKEQRKALSDIAETESFKEKFKYIAGVRPWTHVGKADVALPSATQNEVSGEEAKALMEAGVRFIAEGSNMGCTQEAVEIFEASRRSKKGDATWYGPGKFEAAFFKFMDASCVTNYNAWWWVTRIRADV